jgi:5,10-methylene-tetrahydrofolate dehydrogenase/methenyl tetrahydrofolate cyclohydrolase
MIPKAIVFLCNKHKNNCIPYVTCKEQKFSVIGARNMFPPKCITWDTINFDLPYSKAIVFLCNKHKNNCISYVTCKELKFFVIGAQNIFPPKCITLGTISFDVPYSKAIAFLCNKPKIIAFHM